MKIRHILFCATALFSAFLYSANGNVISMTTAKAYQLSASEDNWTLHIAELTDDYLDYTGKYVRVFPDRLMEAPAIFKKDGTYYFMGSGCTGWAPNAVRSASAPSIWGPWTELGNPCEGEGSQLTFNSQSTFILPVASLVNVENTYVRKFTLRVSP